MHIKILVVAKAVQRSFCRNPVGGVSFSMLSKSDVDPPEKVTETPAEWIRREISGIGSPARL